MLRATQYLPDIVQLQRRMFEVFHHRIDHKVARDKTMRNFIEKRHSGKYMSLMLEGVFNIVHVYKYFRECA